MDEVVVKLGTDQVEKVVMFALELANVADKIGREKTAAKWGHLFALTDEGAAIGTVKFDVVKAQLKDLDSVEMADLKQKVKAKFDIVDDELELTIEDALDLLSDSYNLYVKAAAIAKRFKKS